MTYQHEVNSSVAQGSTKVAANIMTFTKTLDLLYSIPYNIGR